MCWLFLGYHDCFYIQFSSCKPYCMRVFLLLIAFGIAMRCLIASAASILLLSACQLPLVAMRNFSYEGKFEVNGEQHEFNVPYSCHYENMNWVSSYGEHWHDRAEVSLRVIGKLSDESRFAVRPVDNFGHYTKTCSNPPEAVATRLFVELPTGHVESFDKPGHRSATHHVTALESRFVFRGTRGAVFEPQENWEVNKRREAPEVVEYYSVWVTEYGKNNWEDRYGSGIRDFIEARKIPWLDDGTVFPFSEWSNDDAEFAREHRYALRWSTL